MQYLPLLEPYLQTAAVVAVLGIGAWVFTTWLRVKHGYPLEGGWGQAVYPKTNGETVERQPRQVTIHSLELLGFTPDLFGFVFIFPVIVNGIMTSWRTASAWTRCG